ncbi:Bbox zinc finger domain containing protein [Acanthamoeba castellanii str. Neff]|uniref:Bbox zinc finger domain containing protein n=1 Tax=Acanthamoeba castellanii (strain ATCC 30010 / Neff) TaxID=1257118 RepID=L8H5E3_ACACF|nr:Bbox zinc finger domain containing protein [Acanthamoeba castellanii str. Neff]ELR19661.1 Bbox zinc finger domain containing protein [Acanthamoeba castellanii str. Neff]
MNHYTTLAAAAEEEEDVGTSCSICFLAFSESEADRVPRLLKCGHSFCTAFLTHLLDASTPAPAPTNPEPKEPRATSLRCPKCRTMTRVLLVDGEAAGVKGLPRNFDLIDLLYSSAALRQPRPTGKASALKCANCSQPAEKFCEQCGGAHLCVSCDHQIHAFPALRSHTRVASTHAPEPRPACEHHQAKKVEMWCERDGVAVCVVCLLAGPHKGHDAVTIEAAEERVREAARVELAQVEAAMGEVEAAMEGQAAREAGEQESVREARAAIEQHFDQMREAVAQRERALGAEVDEWERARAEVAAERRVELAEAQTRLAAAGKALQQQQQQRGGLGRSATWGDSAAACQAARTAAAVSGTQASSSSIAFASEDTWVQVVCSSGRLERPMAAAAARGVLLDDTAGMPGTQRTLGSGDQLGSPCGVAVDVAAGHIVVADCGSRQVHLRRADDGSCVRTLEAPGSAQLRWPWGVAVDAAEGHIVVTDHGNHRVHVWRAGDGTFVRTFGSRGSGPAQFQCPRGVAVDEAAGHIFVADHFNHRVQVWHATDGSFLGSFGSEGVGPGQFQQPTGVAVDAATGNVIVADSGNHRVQVWRAGDGSFVRTFGSRGRGRGQFMCPEGVAVDAATGNIIVADWGNHRVQVWRADGAYLRAFGSAGAGPAQFNSPLAVAVDPATGHVVVVDSGNKRVQVWCQ